MPSKDDSAAIVDDNISALEKGLVNVPESYNPCFSDRLNLGVAGVSAMSRISPGSLLRKMLTERMQASRVHKLAAYVVLGLLSVYAIHRFTGGFWMRRCQ